ncbi:MAG: enoyl-CoA hydratase/isomerase family protein, partial [Deltaproteobacteria bacterium]|nr:enoyl-CoA hydratase/isomerase family protein [Deltaproteobacteria bacterium]
MNRAFYKIFADYQETSVRYDAEHQAVWCYYKPGSNPYFSLKMLQELRQTQQNIIDYFGTKKTDINLPIRYVVLYSQVSGVFSLGGDLALFSKLIKEKNREQLLDYAKKCVDICYLNSVNMHLPVTTISMVEGLALGGGFESALSGNILVASEDAEMGFPEIRFNLFPGMGAYSLLTRRSGRAIAEKMILSGATYSGKQLYEM